MIFSDDPAIRGVGIGALIVCGVVVVMLALMVVEWLKDGR